MNKNLIEDSVSRMDPMDNSTKVDIFEFMSCPMLDATIVWKRSDNG